MDVALIETLNGGDTQLNGNDFALVEGFENTIYISMFGGNPGGPTKKLNSGEEAKDWWGNEVLMKENPSQQINSYTEQTLRIVALNSEGRVTIENAVKKDLDFLKSFGTLTVEVSIISDDRVKIFIKLIIPQGDTKVTIVNLLRQPNGDFYFADFDKTDFFV